MAYLNTCDQSQPGCTLAVPQEFGHTVVFTEITCLLFIVFLAFIMLVLCLLTYFYHFFHVFLHHISCTSFRQDTCSMFAVMSHRLQHSAVRFHSLVCCSTIDDWIFIWIKFISFCIGLPPNFTAYTIASVRRN